MKKYLVILTVALIIGSLTSCKSREKCPAYGYKQASSGKTAVG